MHRPSAIRVRREPVARASRCGIRDDMGTPGRRAGTWAGRTLTRRHTASVAWGTPAPSSARAVEFQPTIRTVSAVHSPALVMSGPSEWGNAADREVSVTATRAEREAGRTAGRSLRGSARGRTNVFGGEGAQPCPGRGPLLVPCPRPAPFAVRRGGHPHVRKEPLSRIRGCPFPGETSGGGRRVGLYAGFCSRASSRKSRATAIHLGPALPPASCGLPADSGGQPSNIRAETPSPTRRRLLLTLLRVGFT